MVNHSRYQRTRSLRVKVIDNSEQVIEKLQTPIANYSPAFIFSNYQCISPSITLIF